jgi:FkbH-like protein
MQQQNKIRGHLISDFNINNLSAYLNNSQESPLLETTVAPYGQVMQTILQKNFGKTKPDFIIIWTRPEEISKSFLKLIHYDKTSYDDIITEVDSYSQLLLSIQDTINAAIFIPTWVTPSYLTGLGILGMKDKFGISNILMHMNLRLAENLRDISNIYLLDTQKWIERAGGDKAFNPKLWYMGKISFSNDVFKESVKNIKTVLNGIMGNAKKLIILDLDDILWGGIVGDIGWENLKLGGHDPVGEAFVDFQKTIKALTNRGIVLGIVSKNEESVALEAIEKHPEMVLKLDDFVGWKINWTDKAQNVKALVDELNLGLQSVVFIDDNPVERARVREALPEVFVPEWPEDKLFYSKALLELDCFNSAAFSNEDENRTKMYIADRKRKNLQAKMISLDEWLKTLDMKVRVSEINESNKQRIIQLFNKTNQMNLSTRRLDEKQLLQWSSNGHRKLWAFRVMDKYGDLGLTGIISIDIRDNAMGQIIDFILSCRVMGRKVEEAMIYTVIKYAKELGLKKVYAEYLPTSKNKPCLTFWRTRSQFDHDEHSDIFELDMGKEYPLPEAIDLAFE